ncbi:MAG TPA: glycosyltransferase [Chitinophagaceae bacterium]|nr:glycosyltransferase [Chitinophagaceae bacterium]
MDSTNHQVFQTASPTRWQRFKWGGRILFFLFLLGIGVLIISLWRDNKPEVPQLNESLKKILQPDQPFADKNKLTRDYSGFRQFITAKYDRNRNFYQQPKSYAGNGGNRGYFNIADGKGRPFGDFPCGIRAAFYVTWNPQSLYSLRKNISKINLAIPEWFFLSPDADTLTTTIDAKGLAVMKESGVKIMPILSNNIKKVFRGDVVKRILNNPAKKERLINDVLKLLIANNFYGINVDFEELDQTTDEPLVAFQKELYEKLHANGFAVTQDVIPFNDDYNFTELAKYNDYIFLMAYDQYNDGTGPGPISAQKWIEAAVDQAAKNIPSEKLILCMAAYGYDWVHGTESNTVSTVSFQEALTTARESEGKVDFDNDNYNLFYNYYDDEDVVHHVFFTDAATNFNTLRFATEYNLGGVAIWRLGTEDNRLWQFYDKPMTKEALQDFSFTNFAKVDPINEPDYIGYGEVLDIIRLPAGGLITPQVDTAEMLISEENYDSLPSSYVIRKYGQPKGKQVVLSFDDGPDPKYTPQILDILAKEKVPASFFLVGINAENNIPLVKRIYNEGYEIGNHTFTHPNIAAVSTKRANIEMETTRLLIEAITGHSTILFRAPFNADFEPGTVDELIPVALARKKNYLDIGESIDPEDWEPGVSADTILSRVIRIKKRLDADSVNGGIILLHDAGGDSRKPTVEALPKIIHYFKENGYQFTTIADLLHKQRDDLMPPVPKGSGYYLVQLNYFLASFGYWGGRILSSLFILFIILSLARIFLMMILASVQHRKDKASALLALPATVAHPPLVSIIVPAYNEEVNVVSSLNNLLRTDYPHFEIIFVDDGSKDSTYEKVQAAFAGHPKLLILTKPNGGKASALNYGIAQSAAEFVVCIDADTKLLPNAVSLLMRHFYEDGANNNTTGAVAGNVKVGNEVNAITRWQAIEYITSQNFDRKAFAAVNAITVVPGAIGAFRKKALTEAGGFTTDTLAEDCDLTVRILRCGYTIKNDNQAIAMTEAPETVSMFLKQRFRWSFGVMQTFWKNRDALFNWKYKWLGWIALPNILIFQFIIPTIAPLADIFMIIGLITGNSEKILSYYLVFMLVDAAVSILAFSYEKEKLSKLIWLIPQRFVYRWLMYYILFKSYRKAIKGELQHWGVLKRTGNVKEIDSVLSA